MNPTIMISSLMTNPTKEPQLSINKRKENFSPTTLTIILKNPMIISKNPVKVKRFLYLFILYLFAHNIGTYAFY